MLTGSVDITDMNPIYEEEYKFTLTVVNDCTTDTMTKKDSNSYYPGHSSYVASYPAFSGTLTGLPSNTYIYYINVNTEWNTFTYSAGVKDHQSYYGSWDTSVPYCRDISYELLADQNSDGTYSALTAEQSAVVSLINPLTISRYPNTW